MVKSDSICPSLSPYSSMRWEESIRPSGIPPETLEQELKAGKFDSALAGMQPAEAQKFRQAMQNPELVNKLMSTPQAQALYKKLTGGK